MKFSIQREVLLKRLQFLLGVVEKRHTMPVLANILLEVKAKQLTLKATDLEIELVARASLENNSSDGACTIPARKLFDICRSLSDNAIVTFSLDEKGRPIVMSDKSKFSLMGLPAESFPAFEGELGKTEITLSQKELLALLKKTYFSMASQDVRYFLNGMLLEVSKDLLKVVATDGHRLAMASHVINSSNLTAPVQVIVPRKAVIELMRLLQDSDETVKILLGTNRIRIELLDYQFTSKLIDGRYPDYNRVIPAEGQNVLLAEVDDIKRALSRAAILANEQYRGVRLKLDQNLLQLSANNPEQEEAQDEVEIKYTGEKIEIGFNVSYLLEVLASLNKTVKISLLNSNASALIHDQEDPSCLYVVMPIRL